MAGEALPFSIISLRHHSDFPVDFPESTGLSQGHIGTVHSVFKRKAKGEWKHRDCLINNISGRARGERMVISLSESCQLLYALFMFSTNDFPFPVEWTMRVTETIPLALGKGAWLY